MALRNIMRYMKDDCLRKKCRPVDRFDKRLYDLLDDLRDTMYNADDGVGLAASQLGILKRAAVVDVGDGLFELINPEIVEQLGSSVADEGCLSVRNVKAPVERPTYVKVRTQNRNGETLYLEAEGFKARAICHEMDHMDGILFIDKVVQNEQTP